MQMIVISEMTLFDCVLTFYCTHGYDLHHERTCNYITSDSVSSGYPNTKKRKYDVQRSIFDEIRGVWIADETLS